MASAIDGYPAHVLIRQWQAPGGAGRGDERQGDDRGDPSDPWTSAFVPRGRDAGQLVVRGVLSARGGARRGGGERESGSKERSAGCLRARRRVAHRSDQAGRVQGAGSVRLAGLSREGAPTPG